jgi:hypothetical protein
MIPDNQLGQVSWTGAPQKSHALRVGGLQVAIPLWFRIDADVEEPEIPPGAFANFEGLTATLQRQCVAHVWRIDVEQAGGDEDGPEDGNEMDFSMNVYDGATGGKLIDTTFAVFDSVDNGAVITTAFGANDGFVAIPNATDTIFPYISAVSQDPDQGVPSLGYAAPEKLPSKPTSGADEHGAWADSFGPYQPPATVGDYNSATMILATPQPSLVSFMARLTIETIVSDPYGALNLNYPDH